MRCVGWWGLFVIWVFCVSDGMWLLVLSLSCFIVGMHGVRIRGRQVGVTSTRGLAGFFRDAHGRCEMSGRPEIGVFEVVTVKLVDQRVDSNLERRLLGGARIPLKVSE